jgi:hypothetical protein
MLHLFQINLGGSGNRHNVMYMCTEPVYSSKRKQKVTESRNGTLEWNSSLYIYILIVHNIEQFTSNSFKYLLICVVVCTYFHSTNKLCSFQIVSRFDFLDT